MTHPNPSSAPEGVIPEARLREIIDGCEGVTPGPWEKDGYRAEDGSGRYEGYQVIALNESDLFNVVTDTSNATVAVIHDEDGHRWDEQGDKNMSHFARLDPQTVASMGREILALRTIMADRSSRAEGVGAEQLQKAWHATEARRSDIQGFYRRDDNSHYIRDLGLRRGEDVLWSESGEYEPTHAAMMERIELEQFRIVSASLSAIVPAPVRDEPREMTGFWNTLTPEQKAAALAYDGPEEVGDPALLSAPSAPLPNPEADQLREDAERWRALMSSVKMHWMGSAGFEHRPILATDSRLLEDQIPIPRDGELWHFGMEFWFGGGLKADPEFPDTFERRLMVAYVDAVRAALTKETSNVK